MRRDTRVWFTAVLAAVMVAGQVPSALLPAALPRTASADPLLDQQQPSVSLTRGYDIGGKNDVRLAQVITAGISGYLSSVDLPLYCPTAGPALHVQVRTVIDGAPTSTTLADLAVNGTDVHTTALGQFWNLGWAVPAKIDAGRQYAIVVLDAIPQSATCKWSAGTAGYAGGGPWYANGAGGWTVLDEFPFAFRTYVGPLPNLVVTDIQVGPNVVSGAFANMTWTVKNSGSATASGTVADQKWVSKSPTLDGSEKPAGGDANARTLAPGASYVGNFHAAIPAGLAPGAYYLIVQTDSNSAINESDESDNTFAVPITVIGNAITGSVYSGMTTLAGVTVRIDGPGGAAVATVTTNADGYYSAPVPDGTYTVVFIPAQGSGYAVQVYDQQISTATPTPVVVAGADRSGIDANLVPGRSVTGTVTDSSGAPLAGIQVDAYLGGPSCCYFIRSTTTTGDGTFLLELADGATYKVRYARNTPREQWFRQHGNRTNDTLTGWNAADAFGVSTTTTTQECEDTSSVAIFGNWNEGQVFNNGATPSFGIEGSWCIGEVDDYHWNAAIDSNAGRGATPGTIGLKQTSGGTVQLGPLAAHGTNSAGGITPPLVNWSVYPSWGAWVVRPGLWQCLDSDPATWSQNATSLGNGFCQAKGVPLVTNTQTTYGHPNTDAVLGNGISGVAQCLFDNGETITTRRLPGATVKLYSGSALVATTIANGGESRTPAAYFFSDLAPNATYIVRYSGLVYLGERGVAISCDTTVVTDASGGGVVPDPTPLLDRLNHLWFRPVHLKAGDPIADVIPTPGVSTWYRVTVSPHQRLTLRITNPPTQYTVLAFTDLFVVARHLLEQGQTLAGVRLIDGMQDRAAPDLDSPDLDSPDLDSPDLDSPDLDSPDLDSPDLDSPDLDSPDLDSPDLDSPDLDSPDLDSPDLDSSDPACAPKCVVPALEEAQTFGSVYVAAQRRGLRAFSAHPGTVPQTIVMNTRDYAGDVYFRVRPHGDLASSDTFTVTATLDGGAGCTAAPLVMRAPMAQAFPAGPRNTLVITNTATSWFTGQNAVTKASFLASLNAFAQRSEVNGVVVDLANDPGLSQSFADWGASPTCVAQANVVARSVKQLVDLYRAHYGIQGIQYLVMAAPDPGVPFFRTRDDAELSKESRYSGGLDALSPLETALTEDYVVTDSFYGAAGPTTRSGHDFYLSDIGIGRLVETPSDIVSYLTKYAAANGGVTVQRAFSSGYGFVSDLAAYETASLAKAGATVDALKGDTWSADDLRGYIFGPQPYQLLSLQGHGRADRLVPANDGPRFLSSEIAGVVDGRFAGTFVMSLACHLVGFDLVQGEQLPDTQAISFPQAFIAQGATTVGETGYGYGHYPLLKNGEVVMADLADELSFKTDLSGNPYDARGVPVGKALNIAKLRFLNSLADVRGIEAKVINETVVYGAPMFAVKTPNTFARPVATSVVGSLTPLTGTLSSADVSQSFTLNAHTLGGGTYYDAGTLNDTATFAFRPIVPAKAVGVQATAPLGGDVVPRGAVFLGGTYQDTPGFVPVLAIPATQDALANPPTSYTSTAFAPGRLIRLEEFAGDAATFLPFQFRGNGASGTARTFSAITAKLYYSTLTGDAALVDAPGIQGVSVTRDLDGSGNPTGLVRISVTLSGRTTPGIQEVWETYTATAGPLLGKWKSTLLVAGATTLGRGGTFTRTYTGTIDPADGTVAPPEPDKVLVDIQAVGGNGLVAYATNGGLHYQIVDQTATAAAPKRAPLLMITAPSGATYRSRIPVTVVLTDRATAAPIVGKRVSFKLAGSYATATTAADGVASATLIANAPPEGPGTEPYHIVASASEDADMLAGGIEAPIVVLPGPTQIVPAAGAAIDYSDGAIVARLTLTSRGTGLPDQRVLVDLGARGKTAVFTDKNGDVRFDTLDLGGLGPGTYAAALSYAGENVAHPELSRLAATTAAITIVVRPEHATVTLATSLQAAGTVSFSGTIAQDQDGSRGDITKAGVHYVVTNGFGTVAATGKAPVAANADGLGGTWRVSLPLASGVYTVAVDAAGYFTSSTVSVSMPVYDPNGFVTGGGWVISTASNSSGLVLGKKENFGFNLQYKKGATVPTGNLLFQAKESNVDFKATSFDWLVVATDPAGGRRAQFQGKGTVNGGGSWTFRAVVRDAGNTFEIRITNDATGVSYFVSGTTGGGNIVIH